MCFAHEDTSTGVTSRIAEIHAEIDTAGHPALLLVNIGVSPLAAFVICLIGGAESALVSTTGHLFSRAVPFLQGSELAGGPHVFVDMRPK